MSYFLVITIVPVSNKPVCLIQLIFVVGLILRKFYISKLVLLALVMIFSFIFQLKMSEEEYTYTSMRDGCLQHDRLCNVINHVIFNVTDCLFLQNKQVRIFRKD